MCEMMRILHAAEGLAPGSLPDLPRIGPLTGPVLLQTRTPSLIYLKKTITDNLL